jgi:hypothetical protein
MEKQPFFITVIATILIVVFCFFSYKLAFAIKDSMAEGDKVGALVFFLIFVFCVFIVAAVFSHVVSPWAGRKVASKVFMPSNDDVRDAPPEFAELRAKIVRGDIHEAMAQLQIMREEDPGNSFVVSLMSDVYIDITKDHQNAAILLIDYLKKSSRNDEDAGFVMKLTDVYLEHDGANRAADLLNYEIQKKYSPKALEKLTKRLNGIKS